MIDTRADMISIYLYKTCKHIHSEEHEQEPEPADTNSQQFDPTDYISSHIVIVTLGTKEENPKFQLFL